ncbi:hypothetical protein [Dermabacter sp. HSID17554]|uniref:hypothetical protein n=1 Tax=Dermabacter sp. HSID17554 TaxID=2419511 RepID=UPI000F878898|nr:hypothetical protein [Dermabacter sp. HSID17554]RUP86524.1 hypothetical protein D8M36_03815 [Dermabacter sp. HSID17554]
MADSPRETTRPGAPSPAALAGRTRAKRKVRAVDYDAVPELARRRASGEDLADLLAEAEKRREAQRHQAEEAARAPRASADETETLDIARGFGAPPAGTVVTLNPTDPRPFTRPLTVREEEVRTVSGASFARITHDIIVLTVADPEDAWTSDNGASDHFQRGDWTVQVRRSDNHVIGAFPTAYALAVRPEDVDSFDPADFAGPSNRKKKGTRHPGDRAALKRRLEEHGFVVTTSGATHGKITHPDLPGLFTPWASTPSDRRHPQLVTAQVKRIFGIDIREAPSEP